MVSKRALATVLVLVLAAAGAEVATAHAGRAGEAAAPRAAVARAQPARPSRASALRDANASLRRQLGARGARQRQLAALFGAMTRGPARVAPLTPAESMVDPKPARPVARTGFSLRRWLSREPEPMAAADVAIAPAAVAVPAAGRPASRGVWARYDDVRQEAAGAVRLVAGTRASRSVLPMASFRLRDAAADEPGFALALDAEGDLRIVTLPAAGGARYERSYPADEFSRYEGSTLAPRDVKAALDALPGLVADASANGTLPQLLLTGP